MKEVLNKVKDVVKDMAEVACQAFGKDTDKPVKEDSVVEYSFPAIRMLDWAKHAIHHAEVEVHVQYSGDDIVDSYIMRFEGKSLGVKRRRRNGTTRGYDITLVNDIKVGDADVELGLNGCATRLARDLYNMMSVRHKVTHVEPISEEEMAARVEDFKRKENLKNELQKF